MHLDVEKRRSHAYYCELSQLIWNWVEKVHDLTLLSSSRKETSNSGSSIYSLRTGPGFLHTRFNMKRSFLIVGIVLLALGIAVYYVTSQTNLIGGRTHNISPLGSIGLAVLGALLLVAGGMMGRTGTKTASR